MRKGFLIVLAVVLVAAFAVPAMADFSTSGFVRIKAHEEQNYTAGSSGGSFILPAKDAPTAAYVEERTRLKFDWNTGGVVGATAWFEFDFSRFGDSAYTVARNQGAGLEGDSIQIETKNINMWFNVPNTSMKVTAGLQNLSDSFGGMVLGYADLAGVFVSGKADPVEYRFGWSKFAQTATTNDTSVDFYLAEAKFAPTKDAKVGLDFYAIRDAAGRAGSGPLSTVLRAEEDYTGVKHALKYNPSVFYFLGLDGSVNAGPAKVSGYAFYNFGTIKKADVGSETLSSNVGNGSPKSSFTYAGAPEDVKVQAYAVDLRADANLGPGKAFLEGAYVSGTDQNSDKKFKSPITGSNYALAASFPLTSMDMHLLLPNGDDINTSAALAYDVQNKGRGLLALAAGYSQKLSDALSGKLGVGYLADVKSPDTSVKKHKAWEINANVNYQIVKGLDFGLYGAYAFLTEWESYKSKTVFTSTDGTKVSRDVAQTDTSGNFIKADNIYQLYARLNYAF